MFEINLITPNDKKCIEKYNKKVGLSSFKKVTSMFCNFVDSFCHFSFAYSHKRCEIALLSYFSCTVGEI